MKKITLLFYLTFILVISQVFSDTYLHNPRGCNDRNCETNDDRQNANRLFDSQNNARGGYACPRARGGPDVVTPRMYYYVGSILPLEWTAQHSCGNPNNACQFILQFMCEDAAPGLRDGTPNDANDAAIGTISEATKDNPNYGSHETYEYYRRCTVRRRNARIWIADRNVQINGPATRTRQNENGNRHGWECTEERDYYPYFHPTPWKDIAVFTTNTSACPYYQKESENVVGRGECYDPDTGEYQMYNNENECIANKKEWKMAEPHKLPPPECLKAEFSRDNHLGNGVDGRPFQYNWTIPDVLKEGQDKLACVFRLRYNISTAETPWELNSEQNGKAKSPVYQDMFIETGLEQPLQVALNTNQYGRTFQDRSYVFDIKKRPEGVSKNARIFNLNVRGKRGNIVQTYPAVEYDFIPNVLSVGPSDYIHFQWTGSDYNPNRNGNNGEGGPREQDGTTRADRTNIVQMDEQDANIPRKSDFVTMFLTEEGKPDVDLIKRFAFMDQDLKDTNANTKCLTYAELLAKNNNNADNAQNDNQNCMKLGAKKNPYFDGGLVKMRASGRFAYVSTRNNNFSNRSQKGLIIVAGARFAGASQVVVPLTLLLLSILMSLAF